MTKDTLIAALADLPGDTEIVVSVDIGEGAWRVLRVMSGRPITRIVNRRRVQPSFHIETETVRVEIKSNRTQ